MVIQFQVERFFTVDQGHLIGLGNTFVFVIANQIDIFFDDPAREAIQDRGYDVVHLFGGVKVYEYLPLVRQLPNVIVPYESYSLWLERALEHEPHR